MDKDDKKFIEALRRTISALQGEWRSIKNIAQEYLWANPENNNALEKFKTAVKNSEDIADMVVFLEAILQEEDEMPARTFEQEKLLLIIRAAAQ